MAPVWAIPVGVLAGICVVAFIFVWWWFPRAFSRGNRQERELVTEDGLDREERRAKNREIIANYEAKLAARNNGGVAPDVPPPADAAPSYIAPPQYTEQHPPQQE